MSSVHVGHAQCFQIETILADACGDPEGANEMVTLRTYTDININNLTFIWPNNTFLGWCSDTALTTALNNTINSSCGFLKEPTNNIVPANEKLLIVSSTDMLINANSFEGLDDTIYIIYQCAGNTFGHFSNLASTQRTLEVQYTGTCSQTQQVSYIPSQLVGSDGGAVQFDTSGSAQYFNTGCHAPVSSLNPYWSFPNVICNTLDILNLNDFIGAGATLNGTWTGDVESTHFFDPSNKQGLYTITYTVSDASSCIGNKDSTIIFEVRQTNIGRDTVTRCDSIFQFGSWITKDTIIQITVHNQNTYACDSIVERFYKIEKADFTVYPESVTIVSGSSFQFHIEGNSPFTYSLWQENSEDTCVSPCTTNSLEPTINNQYFIAISDTISGCTVVKTIDINLIYYSEINTPTIFTPNGDNQNDLFKVYGKDIETFHLQVYSRWGEELFSTQDISKGWDGTFNNKAVENGIYLIKIRASGKDGQKYDIIEKIKLLR